MKLLYLICLLLPVTAIAQNPEFYLKSCASVLVINRQIPTHVFFAKKREQARLDSLSESGQIYRLRAINYVWQREYELASDWFEKVAHLFPKEHEVAAEFYLSSLYDYPRALRHFDAYDALTPAFDDMINHNPVSYLRGLTYRNMGDHAKALEQFSIAIDPLEHKHGAEWVNYRHYVSRAISYIVTQQPEKALIDLEKAAKNFNRSTLVQYYRGKALLQLGRTVEARNAFQDASFFFKAQRAERNNDQEDQFNLIYEPEIDEAIANLKNQSR